jgi:hypothetical protein
MKTITLRNIPKELALRLEQKARTEGLSLGKTAIRLLEEATGLHGKPRPAVHHDLDALAGAWTEEEARTFERSLRGQRKIDPELWR